MKAICFVDDQEDERNRAEKFLGERFAFGTGYTLDEALKDLESKGASKPDLFLMDMYFPEGATDAQNPLKELNEARCQLLKAETRFYEVLARLRQTAEGGFREARKARERFSAPVVFVTRKGTIDNAIRAYDSEKAAAVLKKPDPSPNEAAKASAEELAGLYDKSFEDNASSIAASLEDEIHKSKWYVRHRKLIGSFLMGVASSALVAWLSK